MGGKIKINLLGIYDLILSLGAIITGVNMILGKGIFSEYPKEWLFKTPLESWITLGIIIIVVFGTGNIIAAIFSFRKESNKSWLMSAIVGGVLFISLVSQVIILGEWYMATLQFFIFSTIQLCLSGYAYICYRRNLISSRK